MAECLARARKPDRFRPSFRVAYIILYVPTGFREKKAEAGEKSGKPGVLWGAGQHLKRNSATFIFCPKKSAIFRVGQKSCEIHISTGNSILDNGEVLEV